MDECVGLRPEALPEEFVPGSRRSDRLVDASEPVVIDLVGLEACVRPQELEEILDLEELCGEGVSALLVLELRLGCLELLDA